MRLVNDFDKYLKDGYFKAPSILIIFKFCLSMYECLASHL